MKKLPENLIKTEITPKYYRHLPENAGIYIFFKNKIPIYIGKAINLKRRVASYFDLDLEGKTSKMVKEANRFSFIQVTSELEALLLEAKLIRTYMPKYNIAAKDDKHPLYIQITREIYPRIITVRKIDLNKGLSLANYGPFPSSANVRSVLRMLRRIFPYAEHKLGRRGCLYSHIGLCNPCPNEIIKTKDVKHRTDMKEIYQKNINNIKLVLNGKIKSVQKNLKKEMENASNHQNYESAREIRDQIEKIEYITRQQIPTEFYMQNPNLYEDVRNKELDDLKKILTNCSLIIKNLTRIECFDVAHLAGSNATASMVTFVNGEPEKSYYRHFRIRQAKRQSDIDSLKEVVTRRLKHINDWGKPDLIIVDGGVSQVNAFTNIIYIMKVDIPVVGIAKNPDRLVVGDFKIKLKDSPLFLVTRIRNEAHRFARVYHHKLISKQLLS